MSEPLTPARYLELRSALAVLGYSEEVTWANSVRSPVSPWAFFEEYAHVVCNSGMRASVAGQIFERVIDAVLAGRPVVSAFRHPGKAAAIQRGHNERFEWFAAYEDADDKLAYLRSLPWIGGITVYHLARNFGLDVAKPDRHLQRIADASGETPQALCERLSRATGDRVGAVDVVLWRAAERGLIRTLDLVAAA